MSRRVKFYKDYLLIIIMENKKVMSFGNPSVFFSQGLKKKAQFFLLAAVIISAIVISLGITANKATVNREPGNFYDFSYEVKRETGAVLDYDIYTNIEGGNLEDFVDLLATDIRDRNPTANFKFVYGNNTFLVEKDFTDTTGSNARVVSSLCFSGSCQDVEGTSGEYTDSVTNYTDSDMMGSDTFAVNVSGHMFAFPISRHKQVIFIMQKGVGDESFVAVK